MSIKKAVLITTFILFVLKHSAGKIEYFRHYSLTGRPSQVRDNWRFRLLIRTYLKAFVTVCY